MNRIKEIYIMSAISQYPYISDDDYLCDNGSIIFEQFNIDKKEYLDFIEVLEKQGIIEPEEKWYEDEKTEFRYDGRRINRGKLFETLNRYKRICGYEEGVDFLSIKPLADEIRKYYSEKKLLNANIIISQGVFIHSNNNLEEVLYYYISAKNAVIGVMGGLETIAQMFEMKYHDGENLIRLPEGFFDVISIYLNKLLLPKDYDFLYEKLPDYIKNKEVKEKDTNQYYLNKDKADFYYRGILVDGLSKDSDYYKVFSVLFEMLPRGGFINYPLLNKKIKEKIPKTKKMSKDKLRTFIQRNLTDKSNGFLRYGKIEQKTLEGKNLIKNIRGKGIEFNNKIE